MLPSILLQAILDYVIYLEQGAAEGQEGFDADVMKLGARLTAAGSQVSCVEVFAVDFVEGVAVVAAAVAASVVVAASVSAVPRKKGAPGDYPGLWYSKVFYIIVYYIIT